MATKKKMLQAAAGNAGGAGLNVEDVFSTYLYTGNGSTQTINNGISLTSYNNVAKGSRAAARFNGSYYFDSGLGSTVKLDDALGTPSFFTPSTGNYGPDFLAADSNYLYGELNNDFYYSSNGTSWTQMSNNPQGLGSINADGMVVLSNGTLLVTHQNGITGANVASTTSNLGASGWGGPYTVEANGGWISPIKLLNGNVYGIFGGSTQRGPKYSTNGGQSWVNGGNISGSTTITYLSSGVYIVGTSTGYVFTSSTGTGSWTQRSQVTTDSLGIRGLVSDGTTAYALSTGGVWSSTDGISWTRIKDQGIAYGGYPYPQVELDTDNNVIFFGDMAGTISLDIEDNGGLVWLKCRSLSSRQHILYDTERGSDSALFSNLSNGAVEGVSTYTLGFNSDGFTTNTSGSNVNNSGQDNVSWTFRKAPKFFDVVTYTGNGPSNTQNISHNLGTAPGMLVVKSTSVAGSWHTWHRGFGDNGYIMLNSTNAKSTYTALWDNTAPTDTHFTVSEDNNTNGVTYVAYLFAHNDGDGEFGPDGDADIIKCGSGTIDSFVDLGWEPQWVLAKATNSAYDWQLFDSMRGITPTGLVDPDLKPNSTAAEAGQDNMDISPTGFTYTYGPAQDFIYIAIRRGPLASPESGTEVFATDHRGSSAATAAGTSYYSGFPVDMTFGRNRTYAGGDTSVYDRLRGDKNLFTNLTNAEGTVAYYLDSNTGFWGSTQSENTAQSAWMWKRAPNFFDVVAYTGDGSTPQTVSHNLGVAPDMLWLKRRDGTASWGVTTSVDYSKFLYLNNNNAQSSFSLVGTPTSTEFYPQSGSGLNVSGQNYIAYLFATLAGVSKVGSYTGNGSSQTIDCGFTSGARFILIKRTDSTGDWYIWDTERGIVAGNDPHLSLNTTAAEVTSDDSIDPDNSGFIVNQVSATNINVSSADYIFYAIA